MGKRAMTQNRTSIGRRRNPLHRQSGQSLVEVALLTPLLLAILLGSIELGRYAYFSILVGNAAHAGALYGAQGIAQAASTTGITQAADNDFQNNGQPVTNLSVSSNDGCGCDSGGSYTSLGTTTSACSAASIDPNTACTGAGEWVVTVSVTATSTFQSLFKYPWIPRTITVTRTSTMRVNIAG